MAGSIGVVVVVVVVVSSSANAIHLQPKTDGGEGLVDFP